MIKKELSCFEPVTVSILVLYITANTYTNNLIFSAGHILFTVYITNGIDCCWKLPIPKTHGETGSVHPNDPRKQRQNANSFVLRLEALLSEIALGGQTQSLRQFQEWAMATTFYEREISICTTLEAMTHIS